jgi:hypothetical protein
MIYAEGVGIMAKFSNYMLKAIKYLLITVIFSVLIYMFINYSIMNV